MQASGGGADGYVNQNNYTNQWATFGYLCTTDGTATVVLADDGGEPQAVNTNNLLFVIVDVPANPNPPDGDHRGDTDAAIRRLYCEHAQALHGYVRRFCPDWASADDIVQETFIRAWRSRAAQRLIAALLLAATGLDLTRCSLVMAAPQHPATAVGLIAAGLAAAAVSGWTARGCLAGRRWPAGAAVLIGAASAPQAAVSGFGAPYTIPDTATAVVGIVLAVAVLATADRTRPGRHAENPCAIDREIT